MKFGGEGTAGDSLSLGTTGKCWLSSLSVVAVYGNTGIYLNLFCQIHTADATQLSIDRVASASAVCRAYWALANCMGIAVHRHIL